MKKHLLFYLVFVLLAINARAQQNTDVIIGTGITASALTGPVSISSTYPTAFFSRHIGLYLASEINATPFAARALTKIAWYKEDTVRYKSATGYLKIYLKKTTATTYGNFSGANWTTELTGATEVYNVNTPVIPSGAGWKEFVLPTPFIYDGTSNLQVFVEWSATPLGAPSNGNSISWRYTDVATNRASATFNTLPSGIGVGPNLPNIKLTFTSYNNDGGISAVNAPVSPVTPNVSTPVTATIKNFGNNAITTANIGWKVNGVSQPDYSWSGNIANAQTDGPFAIGNFTFPVGFHKIKAYVKTVNGVADPFGINDTTAVQVVSCNALAGSNYTINKNAPASATNFQSFTVLAQILNACGVAGPVTVTVAPNSGPYNEFFSLVNVPGTSATNTITIEGSGNTLASSNEAVVKLDRANYVRINNLVITQNNPLAVTNPVLSYGVQLIGPSDFATISNCTISVPNSTYQNVIAILIGAGSNSNTQGNYCNNSLFQNNTIIGGYYAMRITGLPVTGSTPVGALNNRIIGNQFRDFYNFGMIVSYADGLRIEGNDFSRPTLATTANFSGISIGAGSVNCVVARNRFHNTHGGVTSPTTGVIGVQVDAASAVGTENIVKNNLFYDLNNQGNITCIQVTASNAHVYHNTMSIEYQGRLASNTSTLKGFNLSGAGNNVKFVNNIVTINSPGTGIKAAIYLSTATTGFITNNNVLNIAAGQTSAFTGYLTSGKATLADWRLVNTTTPYDMNSVAFNPTYTGLATGNLKPTSPDVNNIGQPTPVTDDILNMTRSTTTPDPGAYEFDLGTIDAGIAAITSPTSAATPGIPTPITVTLKNFGTAVLTTATIGWKVNGVIQPSYTWAGSLAQNQTANVTIGNYTFAGGTATVCAWTVGADANAANDSSCAVINVCAPMAGNYTINKNNPASATNFVSFAAAAERLHNCGVSAKVNISVVAGTGPYNEQVDLLNIPGASAANRVAFIGNGNTLTATPTAQKATVLKLDNADFVKLHDLNITIPGAQIVNGPPFIAVQMVNNSDNDTISNCTITMPYTTTTIAYYLGIFAGAPGNAIGGPDFDVPGNNTSNSVFLNNTIKGGLYGIKINGNLGGTNTLNNRIIGNSLQDGNAYGISVLHADGYLVEGNEVKRPLLTNPSAFYAISLNGTSQNNRISKNRIFNLWSSNNTGGGHTYGLYFTGAGAPAGSENIVSNNVFNDTNSPMSFNSYGIYNVGNSGVYYYYNTIQCSSPGTGYGFYQVSPAFNVKFINNNISITSGSSNNKYALYFSSPTSVIQSSNNNLHMGSLAGNFTGFHSATNFATLADWKTANSNAYDQNSVAADPFFVNVATGNLTPINSAINNIAQVIPAVTTDITGATRGANPDPGAYEFTPVQNDVGVIAIVTPTSNCGMSNQETVTITIKNFGAATQTNIPVSYQADGGTVVTGIYTGSLAFNGTANFTFSTKANLSAQGTHTILARTNLTGDVVSANDATTATVTNATQAALPVALDFETAATGLNTLRTVTKANSTITDGAGASFGANSTKGIIMDGIDNAAWVSPVGVIDPWTSNPDNFSAVYVCVSTAGGTTADSLWLTFDMKQLFKASNANTNLRVTVNGVQVSPTYRPPFTGTPINWQKVKVDLGPYKNIPTLQIGLESSVKEAYANGAGTANLIDNIQIKRRIISGVKADVLQAQVHVFPNPSNGQFNIDLPEGKTYHLEVTDLSGKVITQKQAKGTAQLNLENQAKGIYLLKVAGENGTAIRKLIVE